MVQIGASVKILQVRSITRKISKRSEGCFVDAKEKWLGRLASNQGPRDPKSRALPTAPRPSGKEIYSTLWRLCEGIEVKFVRTRLLLSQLNGYIRRLSVAAVFEVTGL